MTTEETPYDKFTLDATKRNRLAALLNDPVLQEAFDIVDDLLRPRAGTTSDTNQLLSVALFHQSAGADKFQSKLRSMTKETVRIAPVKVRGLARTEADLPPQPAM